MSANEATRPGPSAGCAPTANLTANPTAKTANPTANEPRRGGRRSTTWGPGKPPPAKLTATPRQTIGKVTAKTANPPRSLVELAPLALQVLEHELVELGPERVRAAAAVLEAELGARDLARQVSEQAARVVDEQLGAEMRGAIERLRSALPSEAFTLALAALSGSPAQRPGAEGAPSNPDQLSSRGPASAG